MDTGQQVRILMVEDNPGDIRLVRELLHAAQDGFSVESAENLSSGLASLNKDDVDVLLLDLSLPDCEGLETLTKVCGHAPWVPIVVLTVTTDIEVAVESLRKGAQDYLIKDEVDVDCLVRAIRYAIERKRLEKALRESEARYRRLYEGMEELVQEKVAELQKSQTLVVLGRMVSAVAHDLKNPLQTFQLSIEELQKGMVRGDVDAQIFDDIFEGIDMMNSIIIDLLEYVKPVRLQCSSAVIGAIIDNASSLMTHKLHNIDVHFDVDQRERTISLDNAKITRVLMNLISNAADAMPQGGSLVIRSRVVEDHAEPALLLVVSDSGSGMTEDVLAKIHEPFFTTKLRGTGLGFPICEKIIKAHKGNLTVKSELNKGTTVEISLPLSSR